MTHEAARTDTLHTIKLYSPLTVRMEEDGLSDLVVAPTSYAQMYAMDVEDALERDPMTRHAASWPTIMGRIP